MKRLNKSYLSGVIIAFLCVSLLSGEHLISSLTASSNLGQVPRELRLGIELGLVSPNQAKSSGFLRRGITVSEFGTKLTCIMSMLGHPNASSKYLYSNRILNSNRANAMLSRKDAVEILSRTLIDFTHHFPVQYPTSPAKEYRDYRIPGKFSNQISYLQNKNIISSYSTNQLGSNRRLSQREAISFIYRLYEAVCVDNTRALGSESITFINLPQGHPIIKVVNDLNEQGALDNIVLPPAFDETGFVEVGLVKSMITSILSKKSFTYNDNRIMSLLRDSNLERFLTRTELALLLEYFIDTVSKIDMVREVNFKDVRPSDPVYSALRKAEGHGAKLGYSHMFRGQERVNLTEVIMVLHKVVKNNFKSKVERSITPKTGSVIKGDLHQAASREDFQNLIELLKAKRDKIREIVGPGERPSSRIYFDREL